MRNGRRRRDIGGQGTRVVSGPVPARTATSHTRPGLSRARRHVARVVARQQPGVDGAAQVRLELLGARAERRSVELRADGARVAADDLEHRAVRGEELEVGAEALTDERLGVGRGAPRRAHHLADVARALLQQGPEDRLLVGEVVVERPRGEVGAPDDVADRRRAVAEVGEDLARGRDDRLAVGLLGRLPAALRRDVGHVIISLNMTQASGYRAAPTET